MLISNAFAQTAANTSSATATGSVTIVRPLTITKNSDLAFGRIVRPRTGGTGTVTLNAGRVSANSAVARSLKAKTTATIGRQRLVPCAGQRGFGRPPGRDVAQEGDEDPPLVALGLQFDFDAGQHQRVAQWNQVAGFLRRLNTGNTRHGEHVALGVIALGNHLQGLRAHAHQGFCHGFTDGQGFIADIDHIGAALGIEMG